MDNSFFNVCDKFLQLHRICVDPADLRKLLYSSDSYPSLKSFTDILSIWGIRHQALRIGWNQLIEYGTPVMLYYQGEIPRFVIATDVTSDEITYYKSNLKKKTEPRDSFLEHWNGVALYAIESDSFSWKCYFLNRFKKYRMLLLLVMACLLILSLFLTVPIEKDFYLYGFSILKIIGLLISIFLLRHDWEKRGRTEQNFCTLTKAFSCDAVLSSKASKLFGLIKMSDIGIVYFSGGLMLLLFLFYGIVEAQKMLDILGLLSFCSLPYILFSLSYQRFKVKKWCPLCLGILMTLLMEIILGSIRILTNGFYFPTVYYCYITGLFFLVLALVWNLLNSFIKAYLKIEEKDLNYLALKRNSPVFRSMLDQQPVMDMFFSEGDILIGNRNSHMVTIAINLFCTPCLNLYSQLQDLINRYPNTFCLNIRFMGMDEEIRDQQIGLSLITMYYQDKSLFLKAFGFWKEHKDYPLFQKEFGDIRFSDLAKQEQAKHFIWRKQIHLNQTPAVFVGNRKLPEIYTNEDLVYFLEYGVIGDL